MNVETTISEFFDNCRRRGLSAHTIRAYSTDLRHFSKYVGKKTPIADVNKAKLNPWIESLQEQFHPRSVKRKIAVVKSIFNWLVLEDYLDLNPFVKIKTDIQQPMTLPKNIAKTKLDIIFSTLHSLANDTKKTKFQQHNVQTLRLALMLLVTTGVRVSELCSIRLCDIDLPGSTIMIRGKGNRERNVYISGSEISSYLDRYTLDRQSKNLSHDQLMITPAGLPVSPIYIRYHLNKLTAKFNLGKKITPHMFRHTTATSLLDRGVDIRHVQKLLGHSSINTTVIYTHVSDAGLRNAVCSAQLEKIAGFS